jgi:DNA topoisomerase-1
VVVPIRSGLRYVTDAEPGIRRTGTKRFRYTEAKTGRVIGNPKVLERIRGLAVPPAWTDVWICADPDGHLQATGRDARGRKQYRYHVDFRAEREQSKFSDLAVFGEALGALRKTIADDLAKPGLGYERMVALVVSLLECTYVRVGNECYATTNKTYGLTTLRSHHVTVDGSTVRIRFVGKGGQRHDVAVSDPKASRLIRRCQELPGQLLFRYEDDDGTLRPVTSTEVNEYLREHTGLDVTAKTFRTWGATLFAAAGLAALPPPRTVRQRQASIKAVVETVAHELRNTPAVARSSYIHPLVFDTFEAGTLRERWESGPSRAGGGLIAEERRRTRDEDGDVVADVLRCNQMHRVLDELRDRLGVDDPTAVAYEHPEVLLRHRVTAGASLLDHPIRVEHERVANGQRRDGLLELRPLRDAEEHPCRLDGLVAPVAPHDDGRWLARSCDGQREPRPVVHRLQPGGGGGHEAQDLITSAGELLLLSVEQGGVEVAQQLAWSLAVERARPQRVASKARQRRGFDAFALHIADDERGRVPDADGVVEVAAQVVRALRRHVALCQLQARDRQQRVRKQALLQRAHGVRLARNALGGIERTTDAVGDIVGGLVVVWSERQAVDDQPADRFARAERQRGVVIRLLDRDGAGPAERGDRPTLGAITDLGGIELAQQRP